MTEQNDSVISIETATEQTAVAVHKKGYHSPAEIISWLPDSATPWQQDSAIRANYPFQKIDWNQRPNPMRTPTTQVDSTTTFSLNKAMYYSKSMVQPDSVYRPECIGYRHGVAGDPVPYTIAGDDLITSILLACFIFATVAIAKSGNFLQRQFKNFFYSQREGTTVISETGEELRFQLFLMLQTCLLSAIIYFFYSSEVSGDTFSLAHYQVLSLYTFTFAGYFLLKNLLYTIVNWVFFDKKKNEQWAKSSLFLSSVEGMPLFPNVMLLAYFNLSIKHAVIYALAVIILVKLLSFYKAYLIFFRRNGALLQFFLYFCALELMPLGALCGAMVTMDRYLKQIF